MMESVLCFSVSLKQGDYCKNCIKNRIFRVTSKETWDDVLERLFGDVEITDEVNKALDNGQVDVRLRSKESDTESFTADIRDAVGDAFEFSKLLKFVDITVHLAHNSEKEDLQSKCEPGRNNAFSKMMNVARERKSPQMQKEDGPRFTEKDRLYNDVVKMMCQEKADFPRTFPDEFVAKYVGQITNVLWYLDGSKHKFTDRLQAGVKCIPDRFMENFNNYNNWKRKKQHAPKLDAVSLKQQSVGIINLIGSGFTASWGKFRDDLEQLAEAMNSYADFLDDSNEKQQKRQRLEHPVRQIATHTYLEHRPALNPESPVPQQYQCLDDALCQRNAYSYLMFEEEVHTLAGTSLTTAQRYSFLRALRVSVPIDILRYDPGGSLGATVAFWKSLEGQGEKEMLNSSIRVYESLKAILPEYHTRRMRQSFVQRYCNLPNTVKIPSAVLRAIYTDLTLDATVPQNKGIEERIRHAILSADPDLVIDLRHLNQGRPNDTFESFFDKLTEVVEELTAADERRHGVEHFSKFVSVRDLIDQVAEKLPPDTSIPSESTVLFAFVPKNSYRNASKLYKAKVPLQFKVQTRQLRSTHIDDHYCSAIFKYLRQYAVKHREEVTFLCIDDKAKVDFGEPGLAVSTGVRGKKSVAPTTSAISALDHDMQSKGSLTPSVCLEVDIPEKVDESFYRGTVHVTYKDTIFQPSCPWRHATEIGTMLQQKEETIPPCLILFSDGGPDHRVNYHSVKLSLIVLFKKLDLDFLVAARTAPGHSWLNPAERIMSIVNIALQNVALMRENTNREVEDALRTANTMKDIRTKATNNHAIQAAWMEAVNPLIDLLGERTGRLKLKGKSFVVHQASGALDVKQFEETVQQVVPEVQLGQYLDKHLSKKTGYKEFMASHCRERTYMFQVQKCENMNCCTPRRGSNFQWIPDPMLQENNNQHFQNLDALLGKETSEKDRPSSQNSRPAVIAEQIQGVRNAGLVAQNVRMVVLCYECQKPRCIYSKKKLSVRDSRSLKRILEKYDYSCGAEILPEGESVLTGVCVRMQLDCRSPIEFPFYAADPLQVQVNQTICCYCASHDNPSKDPELIKKFRVVLPLCGTCRSQGKEAIKRNPIK